MPIQYSCSSCQKRLSISRRKAGELVACPVCGVETQVPLEDEVEPIEFAAANESTEDELADDQQTRDAEVAEQQAETGVPESPAAAPPRAFSSGTHDEDDDEPPFQLRKANTEFDEMDLTPMVDVTFLLLIFFMITASFSLQKTIPTPVPDPNERSASQPIQMQDDLLDKSIMIEITAEDEITLDDEPLVDAKQLPDRLIAAMNRDAKAEVLVTVNDRATQGMVVFVLDTANEVGMQKIRLAGRASED